ncbi:MAG: LamG-like jellyroll fold domain-containing protein [Bryobacteraceae bacterium]
MSIRRRIAATSILFLFAAAGSLVEATSLYDTTVLANSPVAFFPLNEASGTTANNASHASGAQNGVYNNVTLGVPGTPDGTGGAYNGTSSFVSVPNYAALDVTKDFSIEAWVNTAGPTANSLGTIFSINRGPNSTGLAFALQGDAPELSINNNSVNFFTTASQTATPGTWNQLDVTYNGTDVDFYIDGSLAGATSFTQSLALSTTLPLTLGVEFPDGFLGGRFFQGDLGDVSFYNTALTAQQVEADFAASVPEPASLLLMGLGFLILAGFRPIRAMFARKLK